MLGGPVKRETYYPAAFLSQNVYRRMSPLPTSLFVAEDRGTRSGRDRGRVGSLQAQALFLPNASGERSLNNLIC
jgi:hypothetical protein